MKYLNNNKGVIILIIGVLALVAYNWSAISDFSFSETKPYSEQLITTVEYERSVDTIMVDIRGEINYPDLYEIETGSRIGDIIVAAGGVTVNADLTDINLAQILVDEMIINIPVLYEEASALDEIVMIVVEIKGEVNNPGVYTLYYNSRVNTLIVEANGFTDLADTSGIELARLLSDGETIIIPKIEEEYKTTIAEVTTEKINEIYVQITGEVINPGIYLIPKDYTLTDLIYYVGGVTVNCDVSAINWNIILCHGASIYIPSFEDDIVIVEEDNGLININTADLDELMSLPGIGQIIGQRVIDYRAEFGDFEAIEDVMLVSGIKDSIYEDIKELITV